MPDLLTSAGRMRAYAYAMVIEHNAVNLLRQNFHAIDQQAYRSSQPTPGQIRARAKKLGLRSIVCLRGFPEDSPLKALEEEACEQAGVKLHYFRIFSRNVPTPEIVRGARELLESIQYPAMFHCKSGADRVGLFSTFYRHFIAGVPIESCEMLKFWPYGHIDGAKTGILDHFLECYVKYHRTHPVDFLTWVTEIMDAEAIKKSYRPSPWQNFLVDKVLNRE